jgi:hypothetical protein
MLVVLGEGGKPESQEDKKPRSQEKTPLSPPVNGGRKKRGLRAGLVELDPTRRKLKGRKEEDEAGHGRTPEEDLRLET